MALHSSGIGSFHLSYDGNHETTIDKINRISIPKRMRDGLGSSCVLYLNELDVISIYSTQNWLSRIEGLTSLDRNSIAYGDLTRMISAMSFSDVPIDGGRVVIPDSLKKRAGIESNVIICGCFDRCEIWAPEAFEEYLRDIFGYKAEKRATVKRIWDEVDAAVQKLKEAG